MTPEFAWLFEVGLIVLVATALSYLAVMLRQPLFLAFIAAGLLLGPMGLASLNLQIGGISLGVENLETLKVLGEFGIALMLFAVGVEANIGKLSVLGKTILLGAVAQVAITVSVVALLSSMAGLPFNEAVFMGATVAFGSTTVIVKMLTESKKIHALHGQLTVGFLLVEDLLVVMVLPLLANFSAGLNVGSVAASLAPAIGLIALAYLLHRFAYPPLFALASKSSELLFLAAVACCLFFIGVAGLTGFSVAVASFIAGVSLSSLPYSDDVHEKIKVLRDFFAAIFFVTLGMQLDFSGINISPAVIAVSLLGVYFVKPLAYFAATVLGGYGARNAVFAAAGLGNVSEFSLIIAKEGLQLGQISQGLYSWLIVLVGASMAIAPYFNAGDKNFYRVVNKVSETFFASKTWKGFFRRKLAAYENLEEGMAQHAVVVGAGRNGYTIAEMLAERDESVVLVDRNPEVVKHAIARGFKAVMGSASNEGMWEKTGLMKARLVILTVPDFEEEVHILRAVKANNPRAQVIARAEYFREALALYECGADFVVLPMMTATRVFAGKIADFMEGRVVLEDRAELLKELRECAAGEPVDKLEWFKV
ncbi:MAG: cation:proton antiporter [Candidatus Diapherotrites archaeon]|uniref:Cation:proton antiporter n=2 Tax=Candidatus Iainarchaeum sp. TaxID=3101447 RepID=A0A8T4LC60_9ARCH|nr:cation:proton antiporter [Candidatus Diapherotrites archaeon]